MRGDRRFALAGCVAPHERRPRSGAEQSETLQVQVGLEQCEAGRQHLGEVEAGLGYRGQLRERGVGAPAPPRVVPTPPGGRGPVCRDTAEDQAGKQRHERRQPGSCRPRAAGDRDLQPPSGGDGLVERDLVPAHTFRAAAPEAPGGGHPVAGPVHGDRAGVRGQGVQRGAEPQRRHGVADQAGPATGHGGGARRVVPRDDDLASAGIVEHRRAGVAGQGRDRRRRPLGIVEGHVLRRRVGGKRVGVELVIEGLSDGQQGTCRCPGRVTVVLPVVAGPGLGQDRHRHGDAESGDHGRPPVGPCPRGTAAHGPARAARRARRFPLARNATPMAAARALSSGLW